jgi:hypothetical protein
VAQGVIPEGGEGVKFAKRERAKLLRGGLDREIRRPTMRAGRRYAEITAGEGLIAMAGDDFFRLVVEARDPERVFAVQSNKYRGYYAGSLPDGTQALVGRWGAERILVLLFSKWGGLYDIRRKNLPRFYRPPEQDYRALNDAEFHEYLLREFGFRPGVVRVQPFLVADDDCGFWVGPLPWHFNQFLAAPNEYTAEEQANYREMIRAFIARGQCVLDWGNEWSILDVEGADAG